MKTAESIKPIKSILVLTDFSRNAKNATDHAILLAEQLHADILLFNSFLIPDPGFDSWTSGDHALLSQQSKINLDKEVARLDDVMKHYGKEFKPKIHSLSNEGTIAENVCEIITEKKNILMVVMGGCKANGNDDVLFGVEITQILNKVKCPTMIVPESESLLCNASLFI